MNTALRNQLAVFLLISSIVLPRLAAQSKADTSKFDVREYYTKYEYRIPMRDGTRLFTVVYVPKDDSTKYPILLTRTPYGVGPYGSGNYKDKLGPSPLFVKAGYIFAYQDVRGRYLSEGTFEDVPVHKTRFSGPKDADESTDTWDTIDCLVKNIPNNNGRVGMWGISYPGFYAAYSLIGSHPNLKAVSPQAPMGDVGNGDDSYHNGAFYLAANFGFYSSFKPRGPDPERDGCCAWTRADLCRWCDSED